MGIRKHCFISLFLFIVQTVTAQINYGTTGLMNLPTADMQRDKTFYVWLRFSGYGSDTGALEL